MVHPDTARWGQTLADLRRLSVEAPHPRTRERFLAVYMIASGQTNATRWAQEVGRQTDTVLKWVHDYNASGPDALVYRRSGGRPPPLSQAQVSELVTTVKSTEPVYHGLPGHGWTLKKLVCWCEQVWRQAIGRSTLHGYLQANKLSWKQCQKVLTQANHAKRVAFLADLEALFHQLCQARVRLIYLDESHLHRDLELGYTWAPTGQPAWRVSDCPRLAERLNCYGAYDFGQGQCFIWHDGGCHQENTVKFLHQLAHWLGNDPTPVVLIWDGAPWHRAQVVQTTAANLGLTLKPLPGYSPDLNPIEGLWKWMREEVTQHHCHASVPALFEACQAFIQRINTHPEQVISRLWPKFDLDPDYEKSLVSF